MIESRDYNILIAFLSDTSSVELIIFYYYLVFNFIKWVKKSLTNKLEDKKKTRFLDIIFLLLKN